MKKLLPFIVLIVLQSGCSYKTNNYEMVLEISNKALLGEGALWNNQTQEFFWVDIEGKLLHIYGNKTKTNRSIQLSKRIGTVVPTTDGNALIALEDGIYIIDLSTEEIQLVAQPGNLEGLRFNDGKCDPGGRFWVGTMYMNGPSKKGALYRIDGDYSIHTMIEGVSISNGIAWSVDKTKMYYIDTPTKKVVQYDYNNKTGDIANPTTIITIPDSLGMPDGSTLDKNGNLWIGMWNGSSITCWDTKTGKLLQKIDIPAKNVTSLAFGGENLDEIFVTTARLGTSTKELENYPDAGSVFKIHSGVKGIPANLFR